MARRVSRKHASRPTDARSDWAGLKNCIHQEPLGPLGGRDARATEHRRQSDQATAKRRVARIKTQDERRQSRSHFLPACRRLPSSPRRTRFDASRGRGRARSKAASSFVVGRVNVPAQLWRPLFYVYSRSRSCQQLQSGLSSTRASWKPPARAKIETFAWLRLPFPRLRLAAAGLGPLSSPSGQANL